MSGNKLVATTFAASTIVLALTGCTNSTAGTPVASSTSSVQAGSLPSVMSSTVTTTSAAPASSAVNGLVLQHIRGATDWWKQQGVDVGPVDAEATTSDITCNRKSSDDDAIFCHHTHGGGTLKYRSDHFSAMQRDGGNLAVELTVAHEMGHAVQYARNARYATDQRHLVELSADCFAGAYVSAMGIPVDAVPAAMDATQLVTIPGAMDAVRFGEAGVVEANVRGAQLVDGCLKYNPGQ